MDEDAGLYAISFEDEAADEVPSMIESSLPTTPVVLPSTVPKQQHPFGRSSSLSVVVSVHDDTTAPLTKSNSFASSRRNSSPIRTSKDLIWVQQFDPRTKGYYYVNTTTGECTDEKPRFVSKASTKDPMQCAALKIQCAARNRIARQKVQQLRASMPPRATSSSTARDPCAILVEAFDRKCKHIRVLLADLATAIAARQVIADGDHDVSDLVALGRDFEASRAQLRATFGAVEQVIDENQDILHVRGDEISASLTHVQKGCTRLQKTILAHEGAFLALDVARVNKAWTRFVQWTPPPGKKPPTDPNNPLHKAYVHVEGQLRKTMGAAAFQSNAGLDVATMPPHVFQEWHVQVVSLLTSVQTYETMMMGALPKQDSHDNQTEVHGDIHSQPMPSADVAPPTKPTKKKAAYGDVAYLQACWREGLKLREADEENQVQEEKEAARAKAVERMNIRSAHDKLRAERSKRKLSIWEAVIEGWSVEKINQLAVAEGKKAAQSGGTAFRLRDSQSENGRTLLQLACWWGHEHLVRYLVEKGSNLGQVDCVNNRFSLLHDAARAGRANVVRLLIEYGLPANILDNLGDTPLHWAARRNHIETVNALLDLPLRELPTANSPISATQVTRWRSVVTPNRRGKRPVQLTTLHQLQKILTDFERIAELGLEVYNRQGASEAAMLRRRDGLAPPLVKQRPPAPPPLASRAPSLLRQKTNFETPGGVVVPKVDERRQREMRVKKATKKAVNVFEKEGKRRATVDTARKIFKGSLKKSESVFTIETGDMDIFMDDDGAGVNDDGSQT
ncbi:Aste57867_14971 [Aphanomyces stellatus]|uniref:Aste57867_14971 protein n=1 Tax=Aphanomyces stellatus TaxID=120398 RepID=A0A485L228_9STRA|nr:hypothetical protein As57867_014915 [Aphanomyces stellatus]VFT91785.1 Aste57867_14971 [Aphanomyces stellatus]